MPEQPHDAFWRIEQATRASVIVDAADYFVHLRSAMLKAQRRIILVGWDFDARIPLGDDASDGSPHAIGAFISWLVKRRPGLDVYILRWGTGALEMFLHARTLLTVLGWIPDPRIHLKLDGHHPIAGSHHQKVAVIDDTLAFCGGIDTTRNRWDTREHADHEPRRVNPNGQPYGPWHDATTALEGPVARALGDMCRQRWEKAGGRPIDPLPDLAPCWPDQLRADFYEVAVGISRTLPAMSDHAVVNEVENLYVSMIKRAKSWIYAESQYFASRHIAEAIAQRLHEDDGPEVVVITPTSAEGWLEPVAMDTARARLIAALRDCDRGDRFRVYHPMTAGGAPIYVHAKVTVIDDDVLRVGSSNLNNRSLRLDSECDISIDAARDRRGEVSVTIAGVRNSFLAEHLGTSCSEVERKLMAPGSLIATIESLRRDGRSLRP